MARKYTYTRFGSVGPAVQSDGTAASGTAGETNLITLGGVPFEQFVVGTQTILTPTMLAGAAGTDFGLNYGLDQTDNDGWVLTPYANHQHSPLAFTIGTDAAFYVRLKVKVADWSGCDPLNVGFHGSATATNPLQVHTGTWADYTDKATIGVTGGATTVGNIQTVTALNNAADVTTDTTDDITDATALDLKVLVSGAGVVTYQHDAAASGTLAAPTTVVAYTFDDGDVVVPFIYFQHGSDVAGNVELLEFECGHQ